MFVQIENILRFWTKTQLYLLSKIHFSPMCVSCMKGGVFFQSFGKYFSRDMSCPIPCRPSRMPSQRAHWSLSEVPGHREWGPWAVHREAALASSSTGGRGPRSAAPPTGWYGLLPKFDCSSVPIFLGVQGWDLATWNKREAKVEFLFPSWHHTQIVTMLHQLHVMAVGSRGASGVTLPTPSLPSSCPCSGWMKSRSCLKA